MGSTHLAFRVGDRFNSLVVLNLVTTIKGRGKIYAFVCDCGKYVQVEGRKVKSGHTKSCGCLNIQKVRERRLNDKSNQRFGKLTVLNEYESRDEIGKRNGVYWRCLCDCGNEKWIISQDLKEGENGVKSCGCLVKTHGMSYTRTYKIWSGIKDRCLNPNQTGYENYGGRGIKICERWLRFENFHSDMGEAPNNYSIERIDVDGNYCPENCKWIPENKQQINRRKVTEYKEIDFNELKTMIEENPELLNQIRVFVKPRS